MRYGKWGLPAALLVAFVASAACAGEEELGDDVLAMSIEDLLDVEVTSVVKSERRLSELAAAVSVVDGLELRRAGHTTIAEALRLVPGFHVAQIDANKWSVSSRGFGGRFANKLLVMVDGRSVYTPLFGGVFWDVQDAYLPDLGSIEVIRGPGASLWGANAVNGVVNIQTRSAEQTQGTHVYGGGGLGELGFAGYRHGGRSGDNLFYRVFAKGFARDAHSRGAARPTSDDWWQVRGGFRLDWKPDAGDHVTLSGEIYDGDSGETLTVPTLVTPFSATVNDEEDVSGGHLLARMTRDLEEGRWVFQAYFDQTMRESSILEEERGTFDVEFRHSFAPLSRHELMWGLNYRVTTDRIRDSFAVRFPQSGRTDHLVGFFVQDEIRLLDERLRVTLGTKLEFNDYSGVELQPSGRILWRPGERHSLWLSAARAVRSPTRADEGVGLATAVFPSPGGPVVATITGSDDFDSEELLAFECGARWRARPDLTFDVAGFANLYENLRTVEPGPIVPGNGALVAPLLFDNRMDGEAYGVEVSANWQVCKPWRLAAGYGFLTLDVHPEPGTASPSSAEGESPRNSAHLRSRFEWEQWELDWTVYYVDSLPALRVGSYVRADLHVGYRFTERTLLELVVRNLFDPRHREFVDGNAFENSTEVPTVAFLQLTHRW